MPPAANKTTLPLATLTSSRAQKGCKDAKGCAGGCPVQQRHPLRCSRLPWPLPVPVHARGDWGGARGELWGATAAYCA